MDLKNVSIVTPNVAAWHDHKQPFSFNPLNSRGTYGTYAFLDHSHISIGVSRYDHKIIKEGHDDKLA